MNKPNTKTEEEIRTRAITLFWKYTSKTITCWNWIGEIDKHKLPCIRFQVNDIDHWFTPRRLSLEIHGKPVDSRVQPLICQNKLCVNPEHLVSGDVARFWAKVDKSGKTVDDCWNWTAGKDKDMYGKFSIRIFRKVTHIRAHIYSWELFSGIQPVEGICVCHTCDNPSCVNPQHLFLATNAGNTRDKVNKGRQAKGETNGQSKLTEAQVIKIRELCFTTTGAQLSKLFGVSHSVISAIIRRKTWRHI